MPNYVYNEVVIDAPATKVRQHVTSANSPVDFAILVPLPLNYWAGSVSKEHEQNFPGTQLDAARTMWGTKWNAHKSQLLVPSEQRTLLTFQTAWRPPRGWICALFNTLKCDIVSNWLSEGGYDAFREIWVPHTPEDVLSPRWKAEVIEEGSVDYRRLHKGLWGVEEFKEEDQ